MKTHHFQTVNSEKMGKKFTGGYIGDLSEEQQQAIIKLRENVSDFAEKVESWNSPYWKLNDRILLKFLRARDFNLEKATEMLRKTLEFREKWRPESIKATEEHVAKGLSTGTWRLAGSTKKGHPIQLIQAGKFIPSEVESPEQYTRNIIFHREKTGELLEKEGWKVETSVVIFDMNGWSLFVQGTPSGMSFTRILIEVVQNHYPEMLETAVIFNAPFVFRTAWAIIKPWLDPATAARVIFVTDPKQLHEFIDPEVLEVKYGGTKTDEYPILTDWFV